ncbi:MAG TPA: alkaline phosphatase family protein [Kofleriaceae bacterium]|nr:alkaline phosphatase family protein [Kofleriaceae bacterium]
MARCLTLAAVIAGGCGGAGGAPSAPGAPPAPGHPSDRTVIVVVWDGLRPDAITADVTRHLAILRDAGTDFTDHHATYPTFTMVNAASLATGAYPGATGFYGNVLWQPGATGKDAAGKDVDFRQPVFTEDYAVLDALKLKRRQLLQVDTLFDLAHAAGVATAAIGKTGAAYLQDNARAGVGIDERIAWPLATARRLQAAGVVLPPTAPGAFSPGALAVGDGSANPVKSIDLHKLADGVTVDPDDAGGSPSQPAIHHLVDAFLDHVLPEQRPRLSVVWLRDPDTTEHTYGIGTVNWRKALHENDERLGEIIDRVRTLGLAATTDIIVVSDHGHSNVAGPASVFPLRAIRDGEIGEVDPRGHSAAGLVRISDILRRAGLNAVDGLGCTFTPGMTGLRRDGTPVYPTRSDGACANKPYQVGASLVPRAPEPIAPGTIVVAVNGGSDYLYVYKHDPAVVARAVRVLQERAEVGAIFVDDRFALPGTLPLSKINARHGNNDNPDQPDNPDVIFSYDFDPDAVVEGVPGTELAGMLNGSTFRGMHGSFSPRDVHNVLIAAGPDFRAGFRDPLPTSNVDVAPTIARVLGFAMPRAQGRVLHEALVGGPALAAFHVAPGVIRSALATGLTVRAPTDPDGKDVVPGASTYSFELRTKTLSFAGALTTYFDSAKATRR